MKIYEDGKLISRDSLTNNSDIPAFLGFVTIQSLTAESDSSYDRPAAQVASFILKRPISRFQSLLTNANINPLYTNIDNQHKDDNKKPDNSVSFIANSR